MRCKHWPAREAVHARDEELRVRQRAIRERRPGLHQAGPGPLDTIDVPAVGVTFSRQPGGSPVADGAGLPAAARPLELPCEFLVLIQIGPVDEWQGVGHTKLLSTPGVRPIRQGGSYLMRRSCGWARPFPRTGGAPRARAQYILGVLPLGIGRLAQR